MQRRYALLDVFTNKPLSGNPLAVVLDGAGLDDQMMQRIASEFNLSETVFVTSLVESGARAHIRIFTPMYELPFAGHPTVGTAVLVAGKNNGSKGRVSRDLVLEEKIGPVQCHVNLAATANGSISGNATFTMPQLPEQVGNTGSLEQVAGALGLEAADIGFGTHRPEQWSGGVPYSLVPVAGIDAIARISPDTHIWPKAFGEDHHNNAFVYCRECSDDGNDFHARMFWPGAGVREDPATGSAVAAFAGAVVKNENLADGTHGIKIEQGYEMGRPSLIRLELEIKDAALVSARIGGDVVIIAEGTLLI